MLRKGCGYAVTAQRVVTAQLKEDENSFCAGAIAGTAGTGPRDSGTAAGTATHHGVGHQVCTGVQKPLIREWSP